MVQSKKKSRQLTKEQALVKVQEEKRQAEHENVLKDLETQILSIPDLNESNVPMVNSVQIPAHGTEKDVNIAFERLTSTGHLHGIIWDGKFISNTFAINLLKKIAQNSAEISLDMLARRFNWMNSTTIKKFIMRIVEEQQIPYQLDLHRGVLVFRRQIDPSAIKMLAGMIRVECQVDYAQAEDILRMPKAEVEKLIHQLVEDGIVDGEFSGEKFTIRSNMNEFISELDRQFQEWNKTTVAKGQAEGLLKIE